MKKFKKDISSSCSFCDISDETVVHLFWHCPFAKMFWQDVLGFIRSEIYNESVLYWKDAVLGFVDFDQSKKGHFNMINLILLLAKFHIHKSKYLNAKTSLSYICERT